MIGLYTHFGGSNQECGSEIGGILRGMAWKNGAHDKKEKRRMRGTGTGTRIAALRRRICVV